MGQQGKAFLVERIGLKVDFEIGDALDKLVRLKLVESAGNGYRAVPLDAALKQMNGTVTA